MKFLILLLTFLLLVCYLCFRMAFLARRPRITDKDAIDIPTGPAYEPFREQMEQWVLTMRSLAHETFTIESFDGLRLCARYYEYAPDAPIELMFHGYRGNAERDLSGGIERCFRLGHSAFIVDQRCSGDSEGKVITFGICEHKDCLSWLSFMKNHFGPEARIILTGISMGASTVLMAAGTPLPDQVVGVLADCGYSTPKDIMFSVIRQMHLPPALVYPFVRLAARIFGRFNLEETSPMERLANCQVPVIFFHGDKDTLVPCFMSQVMYDACPSRKKLVITPGAAHGLCYPVDPEGYLKALREFFGSDLCI